jgi:hypothetical protein
MQTCLGDIPIPMKHPARNDFHIVVTEAGVNVTFKPTNRTYSFYRVADNYPVWCAGVQHGGHDTGDYPSDEVQAMAQQIASEHARSIWPGSLRTVSLARVPQRIASEVAATLRLIQNLDEAD